LHNAIARHVADCEDVSHGDFSFRLNFSLQGWQENLPMSDYFWLREAQLNASNPISRYRMACRVLTIGALSAELYM